MFKSQKFLIVGVAAALLAGIQSQASAITATSFDWETPGSVCMPSDGKTSEWTWGPNFGVNRNCSSCTGSANLVCPLSTLFTGGGSGGSGTFGFLEVDVYDRSSTANVSCTLFLINLDGSNVFTQTQTSSGNSPNVQLLSFNVNVSEGSYANATVQCSVPAATSSGVSHVANFITSASTP
jgi:hypothetical protein